MNVVTMRLDAPAKDKSNRPRRWNIPSTGWRKTVLLNETGSAAKPEYAVDFVKSGDSGEFKRCFPHDANRPLIVVFASLNMSRDVGSYVREHGVFAAGMGDEATEVLHLEEVRQGGVQRAGVR